MSSRGFPWGVALAVLGVAGLALASGDSTDLTYAADMIDLSPDVLKAALFGDSKVTRAQIKARLKNASAVELGVMATAASTAGNVELAKALGRLAKAKAS